MSKPQFNPNTFAQELAREKSKIVSQLGMSHHNDSEAITRGFDAIIQLLTPWVTDYQVLQQKVGELEKELEKYKPKKIDPPKTETTPKKK